MRLAILLEEVDGRGPDMADLVGAGPAGPTKTLLALAEACGGNNFDGSTNAFATLNEPTPGESTASASSNTPPRCVTSSWQEPHTRTPFATPAHLTGLAPLDIADGDLLRVVWLLLLSSPG
jgi:hypothetical protein